LLDIGELIQHVDDNYIWQSCRQTRKSIYWNSCWWY
jgi:hypothetical protein